MGGVQTEYMSSSNNEGKRLASCMRIKMIENAAMKGTACPNRLLIASFVNSMNDAIARTASHAVSVHGAQSNRNSTGIVSRTGKKKAPICMIELAMNFDETTSSSETGFE